MLTTTVRKAYESDSSATARAAAVPDQVAAKLSHVTGLAAMARAAQRAMAELLKEAHEERRDCEAALTRARADAASHPPRHFMPSEFASRLLGDPPATPGDRPRVVERWTPGDRSLEVPGLETRLEVIRREIERLTPQVAAAAERAHATGRLAERCADWMQCREVPAVVDAVAAMSVEASLLSLPREPKMADVSRVRDELRTLADERADIDRIAVPLADAQARVMAIVDAAPAAWAFDVGRFFNPDYNPGAESGGGVLPQALDLDSFRAFVVQLLGAQIKAALVPLLERESERRGLALSDDERASRLATIDRKARTAAVREELLVLRLEAAGIDVLRRSDADPEIVLCAVLAR